MKIIATFWFITNLLHSQDKLLNNTGINADLQKFPLGAVPPARSQPVQTEIDARLNWCCTIEFNVN